jgi:predicted acyl esterase
MPVHSHLCAQPIRPGDIVPVEVEILASSTLFENGSTLRVEIGGRDALRYPAFSHRPTVNRGRHSVLTGGPYDSHLLVPIADR